MTFLSQVCYFDYPVFIKTMMHGNKKKVVSYKLSSNVIPLNNIQLLIIYYK